jgi:hypothetical protein
LGECHLASGVVDHFGCFGEKGRSLDYQDWLVHVALEKLDDAGFDFDFGFDFGIVAVGVMVDHHRFDFVVVDDFDCVG